MNAMNNELLATAYHEAGHAVVALVLNMDLKHVTIAAKDDCNGETSWTLEKDMDEYAFDNDETFFQNQIMYYLAGQISEEMFTGAKNEIGASDDNEKVIILILELSGNEQQLDEIYQNLYARACDLVNTYWNAIQEIAMMLIERQTLNYQEAYYGVPVKT